MPQTVLVTGSSGLIGSEVCAHFAAQGFCVHGLDNNQRAVFFGPEGDTRWNQHRLLRELRGFQHHDRAPLIGNGARSCLGPHGARGGRRLDGRNRRRWRSARAARHRPRSSEDAESFCGPAEAPKSAQIAEEYRRSLIHSKLYGSSRTFYPEPGRSG